MNNSNYIGAEWVRVDLHLHSPGVDSFNLPPGINLNSKEDKDKIVADYIEKLRQANIKVAAVTDYNGIISEWFMPIRDAAKEQGIFILPGAELSISLAGGKYGLHLITIFEDKIDISGFNTFLHSLDKNPQNPLLKARTHRDIESSLELEELVKKIREKYNCLIIFALPEEDKGLLKSFSPGDTAKYISTVKPDALEYFSDAWKNKLISTNSIGKDSLDKIAILENSDPKSIDDIGNKSRDGKTRATYLKLSDFSLSSLKLALHDTEVRVKLYEAPEMFHSRITSFNINGTTFLKDINLKLNPELNIFIGGRGVGKSAIIESIRYCLDLPIYAENSQRIDFVSAVVGSGGETYVDIDKYYGQKKTSYRIKRIIGKEPEVYDDSGGKLHLSPAEIFEKEKNPIIIGQKELYVISQDEKFLLQLTDQFIGDKIKSKQKEFEELKIKLNENGEKKGFKKYMSNLLQGSGLHKDAVDSIVEAEELAVDGILISDFIASGKDRIIEKFNITDKMAERLIEYLKDKNRLFEFETLFPEDLIEIELNVDGKLIPLHRLSPGQRATALLLLMFIMEDRILILDQPEEDLDNRFIYEDVVHILRGLKGGRQIITATHNANIPVIGDSELIVVLDKQEEQCKLVDRGSIDKQTIKEDVKKIMEGGEEAFIRRAEKYGGIL